MFNILLQLGSPSTAGAAAQAPDREPPRGEPLASYPLLRSALARAERNGLLAAERRRLASARSR